MDQKLLELLTTDTEIKNGIDAIAEELSFPAKTCLLFEGAISNHLYILKKGVLRLWFNQDGRDITFQFFLEGQSVASIESFLHRKPSLFSLESIEPVTVWRLRRDDFISLTEKHPALKEILYQHVTERLINYSHLFLSRITDKPETRYHKLVTENPDIVKRIPQHYLASYLGITPVSLSRIRNRK
ncbi:MAG: Crp/Fnr family transcriptional regulator [Bacteroidales bacterium]